MKILSRRFLAGIWIFLFLGCAYAAAEDQYGSMGAYAPLFDKGFYQTKEEGEKIDRFWESTGKFSDELGQSTKKDLELWTRFFSASLKFDHFDSVARFYGYNVYAFLLSYHSEHKADEFAALVAQQPRDVQQRIRDFIYFDAARAPVGYRKEREKLFRTLFKMLFPPDYVFGKNDPIFKEG